MCVCDKYFIDFTWTYTSSTLNLKLEGRVRNKLTQCVKNQDNKLVLSCSRMSKKLSVSPLDMNPRSGASIKCLFITNIQSKHTNSGQQIGSVLLAYEQEAKCIAMGYESSVWCQHKMSLHYQCSINT